MKKATHIPVREMPAYTLADASRYLHIPPSTVRAWVLGQYYPVKDGEHWLKPVISPTDKENRLLSFVDLTELHVLSLTRREYRIPMPKVRKTIEYLKRTYKVTRPLAEIELHTDRVDLFSKQLGEYVSASGSGQVAIKEVVEGYLERIKRDKHGAPLKLYPLMRRIQDAPEQTPVIEIDPNVAFGRPVLANTGIRTTILMDRWRAGDGIDLLAKDYSLDPTIVEEAIRCETQAA